MLGIYFQGLPWALPTLAAGLLVLAALAGRLAARLGWSRVEVLALGAGLVGFLAVTTTPHVSAGRRNGIAQEMVWSPELAGVADLLSTSSQLGLNVWLAVPMGAAAAYVSLRRRRAWPLVLVAAVPPLAEGLQRALPQLGRSAFLVSDVATNWQGVVLGGAAGAAVWAMARGRGAARPRLGDRS